MDYQTGFGVMGVSSFWFFAFILWIIVWKGLALWHAAQREQKWWFMALLVINTAGLLEIVYLIFFAKKKLKDLFPIGKIG